jgi:hypothetical protein
MTMTERMTVYFPAEAAGKLAAIRSRSRLMSNVAVLTAALECYLELVELDRAGGNIWVKDQKGEEWPYSVDDAFEYPGLGDNGQASDTAEVPKNFVFPKAAIDKIKRIRQLSRFKSYADVIRAALGSFDELVRVRRNRDRIFVQKPGGAEILFSPFAPIEPVGVDAIEEDAPESDPRPKRARTPKALEPA